MKYLRDVMQQNTENSPAIQSIQTPETAPVQPPFETPVEKNRPFSPQDDSGDNTFVSVGTSINNKEVLPTESANGSRFVAEQSFGWVNPNLVQK
jgi:hypothetical protein